MLDAVAELARDRFGHVDRVLGDEIDADPLRTDQADDLLDLLGQRGRGVVEQQMRILEEEDAVPLVGFAELVTGIENLGQKDKPAVRLELGARYKLCG